MANTKNLHFFRVATANLQTQPGAVEQNYNRIKKVFASAKEAQAQLVVFPELALSGYTIADLVSHEALLNSVRNYLPKLAKLTDNKHAAVVGLPFEINGRLYNMAAVLAGGKITGLVPKTYLPNYQEFYEQRWFSSGAELRATEVELGGDAVPVGTDLLFYFSGVPNAVLGVEICEDLWVPNPPSAAMAVGGATIIANPSASNDLVGKADYRVDLVTQQSARLRAAYVYASVGAGESTTDVVFGGHGIIAENGSLLAQNERFVRKDEFMCADIDLAHLNFDRIRTGTFVDIEKKQFRKITIDFEAETYTKIIRWVDPHPFVPAQNAQLNKRTQEVFTIQSAGLATRMQNTGIKKLIIGLSGGLDSTLALLVSADACQSLNLPLKNIIALTMPGEATSTRTRSNAHKLAQKLGITIEEVPIKPAAEKILGDLEHDLKIKDVTYENVQARYRTLLLFGKANQLGGLVVGTGDLSEIALGWSTYNGDHISHYNVNGSVPKTLVRHVVGWASNQAEFVAVKKVLEDILATPVSPELVAGQETEKLIGPYELHDFFLYHFVRWGETPEKILELAKLAFAKTYTEAEIKKWLQVFVKRFFANQWKRSVFTDGPKVGTVSLSPRGDWRMPSDMSADTWLK